MPPARPQWDRPRAANAGSDGRDDETLAGHQNDQLAEAVLRGYMSVYHGAASFQKRQAVAPPSQTIAWS